VRRATSLVILAIMVVLAVTIPFGIRARYEGFSVPSESMVPALLPGDYILVDKSVRGAERGEVIVFSDPGNAAEYLVKRVVAVAGEEVTVRDRHVYIGCAPDTGACAPLAEPYAMFEGPIRTLQRFGPVRVPPGRYFMMADNRNAGADSREYGAVGWELIAGRPLWIYWSRDPDTHAVRWDRVGQRVR